MAGGEAAVNLGDSATIDTDTGVVLSGGNAVPVKSAIVDQPNAPKIRVFIVGSLVTNKVTVTGKNALAVVSNGDIKVEGVFAASGTSTAAGAGAFNETKCQGGNETHVDGKASHGGAGGGGFGSRGGAGGTSWSKSDMQTGAPGGDTTGNAGLVPLRGGCDGGAELAARRGRGGGAIQLVSRSQIEVIGSGVIAANGSTNGSAGSGGGILLEAPVIEILGRVVANGAAGGDCSPDPSAAKWFGRLDAMPALASEACGDVSNPSYPTWWGESGNGGAANVEAGDGKNADTRIQALANYTLSAGGRGGGGAGRIRLNNASGGLPSAGVLSPIATVGKLATR